MAEWTPPSFGQVARPVFVGVVVIIVVLGAMVAFSPGVDDGQDDSVAVGGIDGSPFEPAPVDTDVVDAPTTSTTISTTTTSTTTTSTTTTSTTTTTAGPPFDGWVDPASVGTPWGTEVEGVLTFRGNPTRTYYGEGPVPEDPEVVWRFPPSGGLCSQSTVGGEAKNWCGTGWTGQPSIWERDGETWVAFGAYSSNIHFLDGETGERRLDDVPTGDIIKGSVTVDPDGYPLLYSGSRDNYYRVVAFDGDQARELWRLSADSVSPTMWNNDWDGAGLVIDDYLFIGGENSVFHIVKLNRGYDDAGMVTVAPELVFHAPGWDDELVAAVGNNVSIENSVAIIGSVVYFSNSGGLVQGWDITDLKDGVDPTRVFRYWAGDDVDASIVADEEGMLYVGVEYERGNARSQEVGQILKLDPSKPDDPLVWGIDKRAGLDSGIWATPALHRDILIVATNEGEVVGIDRETGEQRWAIDLGWHIWPSPVVVDDVLIQGDCDGVLHGFDVSDTTVPPPELWQVPLGGCIESTPAVWRGKIVVGTRDGGVFALG